MTYDPKFIHEDYVVDPNRPHLGGNLHRDGGDQGSIVPLVWEYLVNKYGIQSVLDVGCAAGHVMEHFDRLGCTVFGIDGLACNVEKCKQRAVVHDLTIGPYIFPVCMTWTQEVVEHIEEKYLPYLLKTMANGRIIAMTHAEPGQGGWHHVNEQPDSYWITHITNMGYIYDEESTWETRNMERWCYWKRSGLVFVRKNG